MEETNKSQKSVKKNIPLLIDGFQKPVIFAYSSILLIFSILLPYQIYLGNIQSIPYYIYYSTVTLSIIFLAVKRNFLSPIFISFSLSIILSLIQDYSVFFNGIQFHRDWTFGMDLDIAVMKKYLLQTSSFIIICFAYNLFPKNLGFKIETLDVKEKHRNLTIATLLMSIFVVIVFLDFVYHCGGFFNAITQRALYSSERLSSNIGAHHTFVFNQSYLITFILMLLNKEEIKKPAFWFLLVFFFLLGFFVSGSRSGLLGKTLLVGFTIVLLLGKFSIRKIIIFSLPLLILIGYQSANRFTKSETLANLSSYELLESSFKGVSKTFEEASSRGSAHDSAVGLYMNVPSKLEHELGYTYLSLAFIPIPSAILPFKKPNAAGYHYVNQLTGRTDTAWPMGSIGEAYWNFSYFGILLYSILMGVVYKIGFNTLLNSEFSPFSLFVYLTIAFKFSLGSDGIYGFAHMLIFGALVYYFYKASIYVKF